MTTPSLRRLSLLSAFVCAALVAALVPRAPRPVPDASDLRDSVSDHRALLSAGHAAFECAACHFAHPAKAQRPLWETRPADDARLFVRDSAKAGGVSSGLCMSCHDGTIAATLQAHSVSGGGSRTTTLGMDLGANHPVGVDYAAVFRGDPVSYNDPAGNPRIVLEDGLVGCVSCHATHDAGVIASGSIRPGVCTDCHRR